MTIKQILPVLLFTLAVATPSAKSSETPWPAPVPNFVPPKPGEHPRLLFRQSDVPALRQKAQTEDGKKIVTQLRATLGGGEAMPDKYSKEAPVNSVNEGAVNAHPEGTFTMSHATGFAFLYVLTGDKKYADLSRQSVEKIFAGQVDRDSRYNWTVPGTGFRTGFVLQSIALAYDMCYGAWPEDFRKTVLEKMQNAEFSTTKEKPYNLEKLAVGGGYPPGSNHFGAYVLGPAMVAMATLRDPGSDDARMEKILALVEDSIRKQLGEGFGDMGWFAEGTSCGRISANCGIIPMIQSLRNVTGKDFITPKPAARYTMLRLMHEIVSEGKNPQVPNRGDYGDNNLYKRNIITHMGDFAQGMGAVKPEEAKAMAWIYDTFVESGDKKIYNASFYPHLAVYAFVNWPAQTTDPDDVLPRVIADTKHGYYVARNRWQDANDAIVTVNLKRGPGGFKGGKVSAGTIVWALGQKLSFNRLAGKQTTHFRAGMDGSMELATDEGGALAVDYSGASGAPVLIVGTGESKLQSGKKSQVTQLTLGATPITVLTISDGEQPTPKVEGDSIVVGKQIIKLDGTKLALGSFTPAAN